MTEAKTNILVQQKEISIFRTTISDENEIQSVANILNLIVGKGKWNVDLEDIDNILRIDANTMVNAFLAKELEKIGFECEELF